MVVIGFDITRREPYLAGQTWGDAGPYERIDGALRFAFDPENPRNQGITDLKLAARDTLARVQARADVTLLIPADPTRGARRLLFEPPNRGTKLAPRFLNRAGTGLASAARIEPGDGFLFKLGWALAWVGWQWDVVQSDALLGFDAPLALDNGQPLRWHTIVQFQPNDLQRTRMLCNRIHQPYPVADVNEPDATLTVRDYPADERTTIPRADWQFASDQSGAPVQDREHIYHPDGFAPGRIYEVVYTTDAVPVVGTGLLGLRDAAAFLRFDQTTANPLAGSLDRVYALGVSQTGRMLRQYLWHGLNMDEQERQVFDGVFVSLGGAKRGEYSQRCGQPSVSMTAGFGNIGACGDAVMFARQRAIGGVPKVIQLNSSPEYWRGDAGLLTVDQGATRDVEPSAESRTYLLASTQHSSGTVPQTRHNPTDGGRGQQGFNVLDYSGVARAMLLNLDEWVSAGVSPPASRYPRLAESTAVSRASVLENFPAIPGMQLPDPARIFDFRHAEAGPDAAQGILRVPVIEGERYPDLVSAIDADGNELAGIRLPDVSVPIGTHLGWNPRDPAIGAPEQILSLLGSTIFFPRTRAEREATGDPRPSIEERYASRADYLAQVRAAAEQLADERLQLPEDIEWAVAYAAARYDAACAIP